MRSSDSLQSERSSTFPKETLSRFIFEMINPDISLERRRYIVSKASSMPELFNAPEMYYETREELMARGLRQATSLSKLCKEERFTDAERRFMLSFFADWTLAYVQYQFFEKPVELHANDDEKSKLTEKIKNLEITGCYAQTELGHGSFIRGIETTASYDASFGGFVINSPTITSYKWWIGGLGFFTNHVLLIANLRVSGVSYGPHAFLVQILDMKTHEPLPGIMVGDIGPKIGLNATDNGFLKFEYVRVPKDLSLIHI